AALALVAGGDVHPDLVLADYNLPNDMDGLRLGVVLRERLRRYVPVIILTGDISTATLRAIAQSVCVLLHKPAKPTDLTALVRSLLLGAAPALPETVAPRGAVLHMVDDDATLRATLRLVLENVGYLVHDHASGEAFLCAYQPGGAACLLLDARLPEMTGLQVLAQLRGGGGAMPSRC
ncbi:MAG: response regulator, partial [Rubritepida sp.]|nr:response regulator [Rubritepida sp.]